METQTDIGLPDDIGSCKRCHAKIECGDIRCPVCAWAIPYEKNDSSVQAMTVFRCKDCGAAMIWSSDKNAVVCVFCGEGMTPEEIVDPVEQTGLWLPFALNRDQAHDTYHIWLKSLGWFRPSNLITESTLQTINAVWWPAWIFDAHAVVSWTADSNKGAGLSKWVPQSGQTTIVFDNIFVGASRGFNEEEMSALANSYDLTHLTVSPPHDSSIFEEAFDVQRSIARKKVAQTCKEIAMERVKKECIPGEKFRNVHVSLVLSELLTKRVVLPVWILAYRYHHKLYRIVIHGQHSKVITGSAPVSWLKIAFVITTGMFMFEISLRMFGHSLIKVWH